MQATPKVIFQTRASKRTKENLCPVKLRVYFKDKRKDYSILHELKENDWQFLSDEDIKKVTATSPRGKYKDIASEYKKITEKAAGIINDIQNFSFNQFEEKYFNKAGSWDNVFAAMWSHIQDLKAENRLGYASSFESTLRAVKEFHTGKAFDFNPRKDKVKDRAEKYLTGKELRFVDITVSWLKRFDKAMQDKGKSTSTIGIYGRNLRVLVNLAIKEHNAKFDNPFPKYKPKSATGRKIALNANQIRLIAGYETDDPNLKKYRDYFMFSFLANGMNLADMARLRFSNIQGNELQYVREKTKNEETTEQHISVPITKQMQNIIDNHGNKAIGHDAFIFPILNNKWDEKRKYAEIKQLTKQVNKYVGVVAKKVGLKDKVTSYVARHSWATISKNSGKSTEFISEMLGHSNVMVTKKYLDSFEKETRQEHSNEMENTIYNSSAV